MHVAPKAASAWRSEPAFCAADSHSTRGRQVQRLKTRDQFQAVLAGQTVARTAHFALHMSGLNSSEPVTSASRPQLFACVDVWIGAMAPKRWAKQAVTRNVIKRQIYAVSSGLETTLPKVAHVVRLRAGFDRTQFRSASSEALKKAVRSEIELLFKQFMMATQPKASA